MRFPDSWGLSGFFSDKATRMPSGSKSPHPRPNTSPAHTLVIPLTALERVELDTIQKRIDNELEFGKTNKRYYDDYIDTLMALADEANSIGDYKRRMSYLEDLDKKIELRRLSQSNHLSRLSEFRVEYEKILKGREL